MERQLSVIVPSYNSGERIAACLTALRHQTTRLDFEVIVVDSSDDGTHRVLEGFEDVKVIRSTERLFPGVTRNRGAESAAGSILCFTDADCIPAPDWLENIWKERPDVNRTLVGGAVINGTPESATGSAEYFSGLSGFMPMDVRRRVMFLPGSNFAVGRAQFFEVGGFRGFEAGCDVIFGKDCSALGIQPVFEPSISVVHANRKDLVGYLVNQLKLGWGAGNNRRLFDLPHGWMARNPLAWPLVPPARFARILASVARYGRGQRRDFARSLPAVALGAVFFGAGFARGACRRRSDPVSTPGT